LSNSNSNFVTSLLVRDDVQDVVKLKKQKLARKKWRKKLITQE